LSREKPGPGEEEETINLWKFLFSIKSDFSSAKHHHKSELQASFRSSGLMHSFAACQRGDERKLNHSETAEEVSIEHPELHATLSACVELLMRLTSPQLEDIVSSHDA
jgi:hypothetical protein